MKAAVRADTQREICAGGNVSPGGSASGRVAVTVVQQAAEKYSTFDFTSDPAHLVAWLETGKDPHVVASALGAVAGPRVG